MHSSPRRRVAPVVALLVIALVGVAGCDLAKVGGRCTNGFARTSSRVLVCRKGRWAQGVTLGQMAVLLIRLKQAADARAAGPAVNGISNVPGVGTSGSADVPTLTETALVGGLDHPWDLAFTPDGSLLFTERSGDISLLAGNTKRTLAHPGDVEAVGEAGMLGLAVDPGFASNRRIYTCFRSTISGSADIRVVRWTVDAGYTALSNRTDIVTGIPTSTIHNGCRTRFGPDGYLWVTTGDAQIGTGPQSPTLLDGKVLRVTTDGAGAPGNPGGSWDPRIHDIGHRNPQGLAFRPLDGQPFSVEHGPDTDDEVNRLVAGGNYGWNPHADGSTAYNQNFPMTDTARVPGALGAVWSSGTPTIAPSGATFVSGSRWKAFDGTLAISVLKASQLRFQQIDPAGTSVLHEWIKVTDQGRLRTAVQGPDGNLYVATDASPGKILRITPS